MPRKTKAELAAERAAYEAEQLELDKAAYPSRLIALLERATQNGFVLEVREGKLVARDPNTKRHFCDNEHYRFSLSYDENSDYALNSLEYNVEQKEEEEREAQRRYNLKKEALAKLSDEEREVLGL